MLIATLHTALPASDGAPEWVHLLPAGTFRGVDGRGPYTLADPQAVITASMAGGDLALDENHATDHAMTSGIPSPARGWIKEMQARDDGIWGRVEWTPTGVTLMTERAYRGVSPVYAHGKDGTVLRVLRAALTNTPNLPQLHTLHNQEPEMDLTQLRSALGLAETADETAILAAVTANATAVAQHSAQVAKLVPVEQVVALQTQINTMKAGTARAAAVAFIDGAIKAGKPIAAVRDQLIARHAEAPAETEALVNGMPSINAGGIVVHQAQGGAGGDEAMTAEETMTCQKMGIDPVKYRETRKKMAGEGAAA
jgi:phage I-like protein